MGALDAVGNIVTGTAQSTTNIINALLNTLTQLLATSTTTTTDVINALLYTLSQLLGTSTITTTTTVAPSTTPIDIVAYLNSLSEDQLQAILQNYLGTQSGK